MKIFVLTLFFISISSFAQDIPMIGMDEQGQAIEVFVPEMVYKDKLQTAIQAVQESTIKAIQRQSSQISNWMLRSIVVGIGINIEIKAGPIIKLGALPRFRIAFTNAVEPSVP